MKKITDAFVKVVDSNVDDCSSISQLSQLFRRYQPYMYNTDVYNIFYNRVSYLKSRSVDKIITQMCDSLIEDMEMERVITGLSGAPHSQIEVNLTFYPEDGKYLESCLDELFRVCLKMANGSKEETARILGVTRAKFEQVTNNEYEKFIKGLKKSVRKSKSK